MSALGWLWAGSLIFAVGLLPVGIMRMVIYRSGDIDHTPTLHFVARLALGLGLAALGVFVALTLWFVADRRWPA